MTKRIKKPMARTGNILPDLWEGRILLLPKILENSGGWEMRGITEESLRHVMKMHDMNDSKTSLIFSHLFNECTELNAWQPIDENTPKDRELWLYYHTKLMCIGMFNTISYGFKPTHWQELPEDPK